MFGLARLFLVNTKSQQPLNADAGDESADASTSKVSDFVTGQSFASFTVATGVTKGLWKGFQKVFGDGADSAWVPLAICALFGAGQFLLALRNDDSQLKKWDQILLALIIAATNTLVLWFAALGVEPAAEDIGITDGTDGTGG